MQITAWKRQLRKGAVGVFETGSNRRDDLEVTIKELHAKIGQLALENDFLSGALGRINDASAKR